jgi:hypothetical protein
MSMSEQTEIPIGSDVRWVETKRAGTGFNVSQKEGKLIESNGAWGTVRYRNGRKTTVAMSELEVAGKGKGQLTRWVMDMAK